MTAPTPDHAAAIERQRRLYGTAEPTPPSVPATVAGLCRGLNAAVDQLAALERQPDAIAADALARQFGALHREAQRLSAAIAEQGQRDERP